MEFGVGLKMGNMGGVASGVAASVLLDGFNDFPFTSDFNWIDFRSATVTRVASLTEGSNAWQYSYTAPSNQGWGIYATTLNAGPIDLSAYSGIEIDLEVVTTEPGVQIGLEAYDTAYANLMTAKTPAGSTGSYTVGITFADNPSFDPSNIIELYISGFGTGTFTYQFDNLRTVP